MKGYCRVRAGGAVGLLEWLLLPMSDDDDGGGGRGGGGGGSSRMPKAHGVWRSTAVSSQLFHAARGIK